MHYIVILKAVEIDYILMKKIFFLIRGIKHDFSFINIRKVLREVLKPRAKPEVFNLPEGP